MSIYLEGTASVTNGSTVVTGAGTEWFGAMSQGWLFNGPDGALYVIDEVNNSGKITLHAPYAGVTAAAQSYFCFATQSLGADLINRIQTLFNTYQTKAETVLQELTDLDLSLIQYYGFIFGNVNGTRGLISRTGYTGEDGFEIYIPVEEAPSIWDRLFQVGKPFEIMAAGLAARNTLRLEVAYCLYGHEIDETTTPWEAGLGWIVRLGKGKFIGHDTLEKLKEEGKQRKLAGFEMVERGIARDHYPVIVDGTEVGQVTSGSFAPSLKKSVGLVCLPIDNAQIGQPLEVEIRGKRVQAKVVETPFYNR